MAKVDPNVKGKLKKYMKSWKTTKAAPAMGGSKPDGNYNATLVSLTLNNSKASGRLQVSEKWKIVTPEKHKGQYLFEHIGLEGKNEKETIQSISFAKTRYSEVMGGDLPTDMTELPDALQQLVTSSEDVIWKLAAKTKDNFQNIYVNGATDETEMSENGTGDEETTEDETEATGEEEEATEEETTEDDSETAGTGASNEDFQEWLAFKEAQKKKGKKK